MAATGNDLDYQIQLGLDAARRGAEAGFTELYRLLAGKVAGYLRGRGVVEFEDVTNDVFLGAFRSLKTCEGGPSEFRAWLFGIAWNKSADWHRSNARRPATFDSGGDRLPEIVGGNCEDEALAALAGQGLEAALASLTDDQRNVVALRVIADLSLGQVSDIMGTPIGAVKSLQHRALAALRRNLLARPVSPAVVDANTSTR